MRGFAGLLLIPHLIFRRTAWAIEKRRMLRIAKDLKGSGKEIGIESKRGLNMYSEAARERRQCTGKRQDGERCQAWAVWNDPRQLCTSHAGRHHRGEIPVAHGGDYARLRRTNNPTCDCIAYAWPHRPGGGYCRWLLAPLFRCTVRSGKHSRPRYRGARARQFYDWRGGIEPGNWRRF
jgi:hypothetical protein